MAAGEVGEEDSGWEGRGLCRVGNLGVRVGV
jgi:hypothetical protein